MKLFHLSENGNINKFIPRESKDIWNNEKYVWAISEVKIQNYLFPRECPRICVSKNEANKLKDWISKSETEKYSSHTFVCNEWKDQIEQCKLFKYRFDTSNFKEIDKIAGYFVSKELEISISKEFINNCPKVLNRLNVNLKFVSKEEMIKLREDVINKIINFSIIKWTNF